MSSLIELPVELLLYITPFLQTKDILALGQVSRFFAALASSKPVWTSLLFRESQSLPLLDIVPQHLSLSAQDIRAYVKNAHATQQAWLAPRSQPPRSFARMGAGLLHVEPAFGDWLVVVTRVSVEVWQLPPTRVVGSDGMCVSGVNSDADGQCGPVDESPSGLENAGGFLDRIPLPIPSGSAMQGFIVSDVDLERRALTIGICYHGTTSPNDSEDASAALVIQATFPPRSPRITNTVLKNPTINLRASIPLPPRSQLFSVTGSALSSSLVVESHPASDDVDTSTEVHLIDWPTGGMVKLALDSRSRSEQGPGEDDFNFTQGMVLHPPHLVRIAGDRVFVYRLPVTANSRLSSSTDTPSPSDQVDRIRPLYVYTPIIRHPLDEGPGREPQNMKFRSVSISRPVVSQSETAITVMCHLLNGGGLLFLRVFLPVVLHFPSISSDGSSVAAPSSEGPYPAFHDLQVRIVELGTYAVASIHPPTLDMWGRERAREYEVDGFIAAYAVGGLQGSRAMHIRRPRTDTRRVVSAVNLRPPFAPIGLGKKSGSGAAGLARGRNAEYTSARRSSVGGHGLNLSRLRLGEAEVHGGLDPGSGRGNVACSIEGAVVYEQRSIDLRDDLVQCSLCERTGRMFLVTRAGEVQVLDWT